MRKLLVGVLMIAVLALIVGGATMAVFTDTGAKATGSFSTGTVDITLDGSDTVTALFDVTGMAPGDVESATLNVKNVGSLPVYFKVYPTDITRPAFADQFLVKVTLVNDGAGYYGPTGSTVIQDWTALSTLALNNHSAEPLASGLTAKYQVDVKMKMSADNTWQDDTFTAAVQVDATQSDNQNPGAVQY